MEINSGDEFVLVSIFELKRRIRRQLLIKRKKKRSTWVKGILKNREMYGDYCILLQNMVLADQENFFG